MSKRIIVSGYPKSGNTWLTRLVAELVDCPVKGFFNSNHNEMAIEGGDRVSDYACYKSHHQFHELTPKRRSSDKIIYIIRDPRDITLSGQFYFNKFKPLSLSLPFTRRVTGFLNEKILRKYAEFVFRKKMHNAVLYGDKEVHHWCRVSWREHVTPYLRSESVLKVKYESLLKDPIKESEKILAFLGIERSQKMIREAVNNQSFSKVKKKFEDIKDRYKSNFLNEGKKEHWKRKFSNKEKSKYREELGGLLEELGYFV